MKPLIRWTGGKRSLLKHIIPMIPEDINTYVEPFAGGGAVFFDLEPNRAIINDFNSELINFYKVVKDNTAELLESLDNLVPKSSKEDYMEIRAMDREEDYVFLSDVIKASRFYYLNKMSFNGYYRVNGKGFYNTPYGHGIINPTLTKTSIIKASKFFNETDITFMNGDYKDALKGLKGGDFVYFDPPYPGKDKTDGNINYTSVGFNEIHQRELKAECDKLTANGVKFILSNSNHPLIVELYKDYNMKMVDITYIAGGGNRQREAKEVLVSNYEVE